MLPVMHSSYVVCMHPLSLKDSNCVCLPSYPYISTLQFIRIPPPHCSLSSSKIHSIAQLEVFMEQTTPQNHSRAVRPLTLVNDSPAVCPCSLLGPSNCVYFQRIITHPPNRKPPLILTPSPPSILLFCRFFEGVLQ